MKYLSKKEAKLEDKQYLMDFVSHTDDKKLEKIGFSKDMDFEQMATGEMRAKMIQALEATGAAIMDYASDEVTGKEDDVVIPAAASSKKMKVA